MSCNDNTGGVSLTNKSDFSICQYQRNPFYAKNTTLSELNLTLFPYVPLFIEYFNFWKLLRIFHGVW